MLAGERSPDPPAKSYVTEGWCGQHGFYEMDGGL